MRLINWLNYFRVGPDLTGGIYLPFLGRPPAIDRIDRLEYCGDLHLPLIINPATELDVIVETFRTVRRGELLASSRAGHRLYAPRDGVIGPRTTVTLDGQPGRAALTLHRMPQDKPLNSSQSEPQPHLPGDLPPAHTPQPGDPRQKQATFEAIENAGLLVASTGEPLSQLLRRAKTQNVSLVVANAIPMEPTLNGPLAFLDNYSAEVFTGLSILKTWLQAGSAVAAYSHRFPIDRQAAQYWQVHCTELSEAYPQAFTSLLLEALARRGHTELARPDSEAIVFDLQLLCQVERVVLAGELPLDRIVTVAGTGVSRPGHFRVPLGMPVPELLKAVDVCDDAHCVVAGSAMTGTAIDPAKAVVSSQTESFVVLRQPRHARPERCIRCGFCLDHCPVNLDPARLHHLGELGQYDTAVGLGLNDCLECGICSYVCPSNLPITAQTRLTKRQLHTHEHLAQGTQHA